MSNTETKDQTFFEHLMELKNFLLRSVIAILVVFVCMFPFANEVYTFVANPILSQMSGNQLISIGVISPFLTPLKMALIFSVYISMPYILWNIWGFVAPALYKHEKKFIIPLIISTTILFFSGVLFSFYVVFPVIFGFLTAVGPSVVNFTPDIQYYLDFVLKVSFAFGVAFEVPIATIILLKFGIATQEGLRKNRSYIIIGAFIVGMLLTPPDIISQTMIAIPMWLLFEAGLFFAPMIINVNKEDDSSDNDNDDDPDDDPDSGVTKSDDSDSDEWDDEWETKTDDEWDNDDDWDGDEFDNEDKSEKWDGKITPQ
jgi:sec-independent protein translocase protein TatC